LIGRVQTELLAQQNRELKRRPADSFQSIWCAMRGGASPVQCVTSAAASLRDRRRAVAWGRLQALCSEIDRVKVNRGSRAGSEVIVQCGCRAVSKTLALAIHPGHYLAASGFACRAAPFLPNSR
jgi:hypothetical protein